MPKRFVIRTTPGGSSDRMPVEQAVAEIRGSDASGYPEPMLARYIDAALTPGNLFKDHRGFYYEAFETGNFPNQPTETRL